ncbi:hypothetical protein [Acidisoma cellulosilyticum]
MLPRELGCGSGAPCWMCLRDWQIAGVWDGLHRELLTRLYQADWLDWGRACMDTLRLQQKGSEATGPSPRDRGRPDTKRHIITDRQGVPNTVLLTRAIIHDSRMLK